MNFGKAVLLEEHCDLLAASAVMADRDELLVRIELAEPRRHLAHRDVLRALDARGLPFPGLAHVEQQRFLPARVREPGGKLGWSNLFQNLNRGACSALTSGAITVSKRSLARQAPGTVVTTRR